MSMTECSKPGVYRDVPDDVYRAWPYPSYSQLRLFRDDDLCELEIKHALEHPPAASDAQSLGLMVEQALTDPAALGAKVRKLPPEIKARRGAAWLEFQRQNPGVEWLPPSEYAKHEEALAAARAMAAAVRAHDRAALLIDGAERQVSFVADLAFAGAEGPVEHRVKGRADFLKGDCVADLKTTAAGGPRAFGASFWRYGYDVQTALYTDALTQQMGVPVKFYFVVVRSVAPWVVTVYNGHNSTEMAGAVLDMGRRAYQCYLEQLAECRRLDRWRGYFTPDAPERRVLDIQLPAWAM